jgi:hypothetical protein
MAERKGCSTIEYMHMHRSFYYYIAAAAATAIAGILHLVYASNVIDRSPLFGIFFIVAGLAQLFWVLPMIKRWGRLWYYIGIGGTMVLIVLYAITRVPNPITGGRALPISSIGMETILLQAAYIVIAAVILVKERRIKVSEREQLR